MRLRLRNVGGVVEPDRFVDILRRIERVLRAEPDDGTLAAADHISRLIALRLMGTPQADVEFYNLVTRDKYLWCGMGTIADFSFRSHDLNREFGKSYYELAVEAEKQGFGSIYSKDALQIFARDAPNG